MDSREVPPQSQLHPPSSAMLMGHSSYHSGRDPTAMISPNSTSPSIYHPAAGFQLPFGPLAPHQHQHQYQHKHQQHQQPPPTMTIQHQEPKMLDSLRFDGSPSSGQSSIRFGSVVQQPQAKKKRGRPRKYAADGNTALALAPTTQLPSASNSYGGGGEVAATGGSGVPNEANSSDPPAKRNRGRPPGSGKKQLDALGGTGGVGFTPHVIEVKAGEDIASKIMSFSQQGPRTICVLSAFGAISNVTLRQQAMSSGTVTYEGRFQIVSLSGSFLHSENNGSSSKSGSLSVSLAGPDGRILGGGVAGMLVAGSPVQVIIGSFIMEHKKHKSNRAVNKEPSSAPPNMLSFGGSATPASPHSQGPSSESSEGNDSGSGSLRHNHHGQQQQQQHDHHGNYGTSPQPLQPMHMNSLWINSSQ